MKERSKGIIIGASLSLLVIATTTSALAATGSLTIEVNPVNVQVNGQTFAPKDAQGNSVPVFSYNGTTYAPLRALAEAYGLEVGYDSKNNMATVSSEAGAKETPTPSPSQTPDNTASTDYSDWTAEEEAAYQEFKGMWEVEFKDKGDVTYHMDGSFENSPWEAYTLTYIGTLTRDGVDNILYSAINRGFLKRFAHELRSSEVRVDINICDSNGMSFGFYPEE